MATSDSMSSSAAAPVQTATAHENIIFNEQRRPQVMEGILANDDFKADLAHSSSMPEGPWTFNQTLCRAQKIATYLWTTSQALATTIAVINVPTTFYALNNFTINTLRMMAYYQSDFVLKFQLNSQASNCGKLLVWFNPLSIRDTSASALQVNFGVHLFNAVCMPHVWLDASESTEAELVISWRHFLNFFDLQQNPSQLYANLGSVHLDVFNPLQVTPTSTTSVGITTWFYAKEPKMHVPIRPFTIPTTAKIINAAGDVREVIPGEAQMDEAIGAVTSGAQAFNSFTSGDYKGAMNSVNTTVSNVNSLVQRLDKPSVSDLVTLNQKVSLGGAAFGAGLDASQRLGLSSTSRTEHPKDILGQNDLEMDLTKLVKIPTVVKILEWATSQPSGTVLWSMPVFPSYVLRTDFTPATDFVSYSNLGYICAKYDFWKGSIVYRVSLATTGMHSGKLLFTYKPSLDTNAAWPDLYSYPSMTVDIKNGMKNFEFTCPYYSREPWKHNANRTYDAQLNHSGGGPRASSEILGSFNISVLNPLVAPLGTATTIQMNISIAGGDDFRVHYPSENHPPMPARAWIPASERKIVEGEAQMNEEVAQVAPSVQSFVRTPVANYVTQGARGVTTGGEVFMDGEDHMNVKDVVKRKTFYHSQNFNVNPSTTVENIVCPIYPCFTRYNNPEGPLLNSSTPDLLGHFAAAYVFWAGSVRISGMTPANKNANVFVSIIFRPDLLGTYQYTFGNSLMAPGLFNCAVAFQNLSSGPDFEVEFPFTSRFFQKVACLPFTQVVANNLSSSTLGQFQLTLFPQQLPDDKVAGGVEFLLLHGAGDDFTLSFYIGPPCWAVPHGLFD